MAKFSFDIESVLDASEIDHAIDQARRDIGNRYDFKGSSAAIDYDNAERTTLKITGDNDYQITAVLDILRSKFAKRNLSQKILDATSETKTSGTNQEQLVPLRHGLDKERAKTVIKLVQNHDSKLKTQIQNESVRVTGTSKDSLQSAMTLLKDQDFEFPISFTNFR